MKCLAAKTPTRMYMYSNITRMYKEIHAPQTWHTNHRNIRASLRNGIVHCRPACIAANVNTCLFGDTSNNGTIMRHEILLALLRGTHSRRIVYATPPDSFTSLQISVHIRSRLLCTSGIYSRDATCFRMILALCK